jgi:hypothetical protein
MIGVVSGSDKRILLAGTSCLGTFAAMIHLIDDSDLNGEQR